jgi:hypothetical protein
MPDAELNILTLFARHGVDTYKDALPALDEFYATKLPRAARRTVIVDDINPYSSLEIFENNTTLIGSDERSWEFSSWDSGVRFVEPQIMRYDYVHLVTSAFRQQYIKYIDLIDETILDNLRGQLVALGHIDRYNQPIELCGRVSQSWIRSSFLFVSPALIRLLGSFVTFRDRSLFFSGDPKDPFLRDAPLSPEYRTNILNWLTGSGTGQGTEWHSRFELTTESIDYFEAKALAILNEHSLSIRMRSHGANTVDATWFASHLDRSQTGAKSLYIPHWREQLKQREPYV